jgi:hypothetical protein
MDSSDDAAEISDSTATSSDSNPGPSEADDFASISSISLRDMDQESKATPSRRNAQDGHSAGSIVLSEESHLGAVAKAEEHSSGDSIELSEEDSHHASAPAVKAAIGDKASLSSHSSYLHVGSDSSSESADSFDSDDLSEMSDLDEDADSDVLSELSENEAAEVERQLRASTIDAAGAHRRRSVVHGQPGEDDLMDFESVSEPSSDGQQAPHAVGASAAKKSPAKGKAMVVTNRITSPRKVREVREVKEIKEKPKHKKFEPTKARIPAPRERPDKVPAAAVVEAGKKNPAYAMPTKALSMRWDAAEAEKAPVKKTRLPPALAPLVKQKSHRTPEADLASVDAPLANARGAETAPIDTETDSAAKSAPIVPVKAQGSADQRTPAAAVAVTPVPVKTAAQSASLSSVSVPASRSSADSVSGTGSGSGSGPGTGSQADSQSGSASGSEEGSESGVGDDGSASGSDIESLSD